MTAQCYSMLADFLSYPSGEPEMEELYTRTFDIQAVCPLDVGYVLFGEDYKRGHFLVKMRELHEAYGNDCGTELADHLPNILRLLPLMPDPGEAGEFVNRLLLPAVEKMLEGFSDHGNLYAGVLAATRDILQQDYHENRSLS